MVFTPRFLPNLPDFVRILKNLRLKSNFRRKRLAFRVALCYTIIKEGRRRC
nr:MAG TPA: hypothetical protein [Caudoviricetes sp.]